MSTKKTTETVAKQLLEKYGIVLTSEYLGAHKDIQFMCPNSHPNSAAATNVLQRGYKCKECIHGRAILPKISWTELELAQLRVDIIAGVSTADIAINFSTTVSAINNVCAKYGIDNSKTIRTRLKLDKTLESQSRELKYVSGDSAYDLATTTCKNGHTTTQLISNVIYKDTNCPQCFYLEGVSKAEKELREFIAANYSGWTIYNDRTLLGGKELDIILPDLGLAIEFNGTYWHREEKVGKTYHLEKTQQVESLEFQLLHIYDYYWNTKKDLVKSRILDRLKQSKRLYARNTAVQSVYAAEAKEFFEHNHLQGSCASSINLGLYHNTELVACLSFAKPRFTDKYDYELTRYCNKVNTTVVGGASKLFKHRPKGTIISYADRSFSTGNLYQQLGFTKAGETAPGYSYYNRHVRLSRYQCQKHKLEGFLKVFDPNLSEKENMKANGYYPVYDSGNLIYEYLN